MRDNSLKSLANETELITIPPEQWSIASMGTNYVEMKQLGSFLDFDGDGLANVIEFILNLDPALSDDIWSAITLAGSGSNRELSFSQLDTGSEYWILLEVIDLQNSGELIQSTELDSTNRRVEGLGDSFFFRLSTRRAAP